MVNVDEFNHLTAFEDEVADRKELCSKLLYTGVEALDEVFQGILPNDFILLGAKTGSGKTEMLTQIAMNVASQGKFVDMFALEASKFEIHRRIKYRIAAEILKREGLLTKPAGYNLWFRGAYDKLLEAHQQEMSAFVDSMRERLRVHYRTGSFDLKDFLKKYHYRSKDSSLMLVDHAQFFDIDDSKNEIAHIKDMSLHMYDLVNEVRIPIVLVSHLRKVDSQKNIPDMNDFYGSSELVKKVTRALILARGEPTKEDRNTWTTIFNFEKNREGSPIALQCVFNLELKCYSKQFIKGHISRDVFTAFEDQS